MKILGQDMIDWFPQLQTLPVLDENEWQKYPYGPDSLTYDKQKGCFVVEGSDVYVHITPSDEYGGRPNCCKHCIYATTARFAMKKKGDVRFLQTVCKGINMCESFCRLNRKSLKGKSVFFRDSKNYKTHKDDVISMKRSLT